MIAADDDRRFEFAAGDEIVQREAEFVSLAVAEPADSRGVALELNALLRQANPARQNFVVRKHFKHELIGSVDVRRFAGKRGPAKWTAAFAEKWPDVGGHEAGEIVSVFHALLECEGADVVAVVESHGAEFLQSQHAFHVARDGCE